MNVDVDDVDVDVDDDDDDHLNCPPSHRISFFSNYAKRRRRKTHQEQLICPILTGIYGYKY